jgi:hypothetical protein
LHEVNRKERCVWSDVVERIIGGQSYVEYYGLSGEEKGQGHRDTGTQGQGQGNGKGRGKGKGKDWWGYLSTVSSLGLA